MRRSRTRLLHCCLLFSRSDTVPGQFEVGKVPRRFYHQMLRQSGNGCNVHCRMTLISSWTNLTWHRMPVGFHLSGHSPEASIQWPQHVQQEQPSAAGSHGAPRMPILLASCRRLHLRSVVHSTSQQVKHAQHCCHMFSSSAGMLPDASCAHPPAGATSIQQDETAAFPMAAKPGQPIKLPGQTRVTPEEYREFLSLGHGHIFDLDIDRSALSHIYCSFVRGIRTQTSRAHSEG